MSKKQLLVLTIRKVILSLIGLGVIAGMFWYVNTYIYKFYATADTVTVDVTSTPGNVNVGSTFNYNVILAGQNVETIDLTIKYKSDELEYEEETVVTPADKFKSSPEINTDDEAAGTIRYILLAKDAAIQPGNSVQLSFKFRAKKQVSTTISVERTSVVAGRSGSNAVNFALDLAKGSKTVDLITTSNKPVISSVTWSPTSPVIGQKVIITVTGTDANSSSVGIAVFANNAKVVENKTVAVSNKNFTGNLELTVPGIVGKMSGYVEVSDGTDTVKSENYEFTIIGEVSRQPIAHWKMDDYFKANDKTVIDTLMKHNVRTNPGPNVIDCTVAGKLKTACTFDGVDDRLRGVSELKFGTKGTITAWVKTTQKNGAVFGSVTNSYSNAIYLRVINGVAQGTSDLTSNWPKNSVTGKTIVTDGKWHHMAFVVDELTAKIYVDGVDEGTATMASKGEYNDSEWYIGYSDASWTTNYFKGEIDDVKLFNVALTAEEIKAMIPPNELLLHWKMDEDAWTGAGAVKDSSGKGNTGSASGAMPTDGKYGKGGLFDGTNDYISTLPRFNLKDSSFTVSVWLNPETTTSANATKGTGWNQYFGAVSNWEAFGFHTTDNGSIYAGINAKDSTGRFTPTQLGANTMEKNKWQYFTFTYEFVGLGASNPAKFYKDGKLLASKNMDNPTEEWGGFTLGFDSLNTIDGKVDDVRIYNYVLTEEQIQKDMNSGVTPSTSPTPTPPPPWVNTDYTKTTLWGVVQTDQPISATVQAQYWQQNKDVCEGTKYPVDAEMTVASTSLKNCYKIGNTPVPYFISEVLNPGNNLAYTLENVPKGYECSSWEHRLRVKSDGAPKQEAAGTGCTTGPLNISIQDAESSYENSHFILFKIKKIEVPTPPGGELYDAKLKIKLRFQAIDKLPKAEEVRKMIVGVGIKGSDGMGIAVIKPDNSVGEETPVEFTAQDDGTWLGEYELRKYASSDKTFMLYFKGPKHIKKKICDNSPSETLSGVYNCEQPKIEIKPGINELDFSKIVLLAGDLPVQDGIINSLDYAFVRQNLGSSDNEILKRADLNLDGIVDTQDHTMIKTALEFKYDEE